MIAVDFRLKDENPQKYYSFSFSFFSVIKIKGSARGTAFLKRYY